MDWRGGTPVIAFNAVNAPLLQSFGSGLWLAEGTQTQTLGFHYPTRMALIRLSDGGLFVWSPVALSEGLKAEVEALGEVRYLVAPNSLHHLFLGAWQKAFPSARLYAAPGLRQRRQDLAFDEDLGDTPVPDWSADIDQVVVRGNAITTEMVFFHRQSATLLVTDLIQQFRPGWFTGWRAFVARLDDMTATEPSVPRKFRLAFVDRSVARAAVRRILDWPAGQLVMAHGPPIERDGKAVVARAFRWLTGP